MNRYVKFSKVFATLMAAGLMFACSGSESSGGDACNAGNTGFTECNAGLTECQPGQFCDSEMLSCSVGCTSDVNCASNQFCNLESGSPGVCENCVVQEQETTGGGSSGGFSCADAVDALIACGFTQSAERAAAITTCETDESGDFAQVLSCIETAGDDCDQVGTCVGANEGGGGGGGMPGSCTDDSDCDQTPGITHQICSGGMCIPGCRDNEDCGQDYICDDFSNQCMPDDFG